MNRITRSEPNRDLKPGDVVLYTVSPKSALASRIVAAGELLWGTGRGLEQYSHAAILSRSPGWQYEAKWPRTGLYRVDDSRAYEVWRIDGVSADQRERILRWCQQHLGEFYDMIELLTFGLFQHRHAAVCSQFVGRAYAAAGIHIAAEGKRILSPNAIADWRRSQCMGRYTPRAGWVARP